MVRINALSAMRARHGNKDLRSGSPCGAAALFRERLVNLLAKLFRLENGVGLGRNRYRKLFPGKAAKEWVMSGNKSGALVLVLAASLVLLIFLGQTQEAVAAASYRGAWETKENEDGRILQSTSNQLGLDLRQFLTDRLSSSEKVTYTERWAQGSGGQETLSPGASLFLDGDIFDASLAVDSVQTTQEEITREDDSLGLTWSSQWKKRLIPTLNANYDYKRRSVDSGNASRVENSDTLGGQVNWNLLLANIFYSYQREQTSIAASEFTQESHLATIAASRSLLANRLAVSLGHEYIQTSSERLTPFVSNTVSFTFSLSEVRTGTDPSPADIDESMLSSTFTMRDGDLLLPAYSPAAGGNNNSILLVTNGQPVNNLYLYTQNNLGPAPLGVNNWRVYSNSLLGNTWNLEAAPSVSYDPTNQRFVLVLPATSAAYLKVVFDLDVIAPALNFTEVKVEQVLTGTVGTTLELVSEFQSNKSNFALDYRFNQAASFFYNFFGEQSKSASLLLAERESHNVGVRLRNSAGDLNSVLGYSLARQQLLTSPEMQTDSYRLNVNKILLPTLTVALSGSHDESSRAGAPISETDIYSFYADAKLYPDLTSRLDVQYWEEERFNAEGGNHTDGLRTSFILTSRFRPSLTLSLADIYEVQHLDGQGLLNQNTTSLSGNWHLSEWLAVQGAAQNVSSKATHDAYTFTAGVRLGLAIGAELDLAYSWVKNISVSQSGHAKLNLTANRNLAFEIGCNYAESEAAVVRNVYEFYSRVSLQFTTL